jgi:hypothetical protein
VGARREDFEGGRELREQLKKTRSLLLPRPHPAEDSIAERYKTRLNV